MQQTAGLLEDGLEVRELFDGSPGHPQNRWKVIGRIGKGDRHAGALLPESLVKHELSFRDQGIGSADGASGNVF